MAITPFPSTCSRAHQSLHLLESVEELAKLEAELRPIYAAWAAGDVERLDELLNDELRESAVGRRVRQNLSYFIFRSCVTIYSSGGRSLMSDT